MALVCIKIICKLCKAVCNWNSLWKPTISDYFVGISQVAQNPMKFAMQTPSVWKQVPVSLTFKHAEKYGQTGMKFIPPPPTPLKPCLPTNGKKRWGTLFHIRRVVMPNLSRFWATWKSRRNRHLHGPVHGSCSSWDIIKLMAGTCKLTTVYYRVVHEWKSYCHGMTRVQYAWPWKPQGFILEGAIQLIPWQCV